MKNDKTVRYLGEHGEAIDQRGVRYAKPDQDGVMLVVFYNDDDLVDEQKMRIPIERVVCVFD